MEQKDTKEELRRLRSDCQAFVDVANRLSDEQFAQQIDGKWSVAEVMQHLYLSARPVAKLMAGARDVLLQWGEPSASSRPYDEMITAYQNVLATGVKAPVNMSRRNEDMLVDKETLVSRFTTIYQALLDASSNWRDSELDEYVIPHPALGKITVREMLHFTSLHTQHHLRLLPEL